MNCPLHRNSDGSYPPCMYSECGWWDWKADGCVIQKLGVIAGLLEDINANMDELSRLAGMVILK